MNKKAKQEQTQNEFKKTINTIFTTTGFSYVPTDNHHLKVGRRTVEVDALFIYENIWILCEDTVINSKKQIKEHIRSKSEAMNEIINNVSEFRDNLVRCLPEHNNILYKYDVDRIKLYGLYFSKTDFDLKEEEQNLYSNLTFVTSNTLKYFDWISQCIKLSARNEIFRYLSISNSDVGLLQSSSSDSRIMAPIIYPNSFTGLKNGVRIVSFMMSAKDLLDTCYVLRKDDWSDSIWLYQRLLDKNKISSIRNFLEKKGAAFYNNIIVALPDNVTFYDDKNHPKTIEEVSELSGSQLVVPKKMNSICVIDGQHRIFAHYESGTDSEQETKISKLRDQLHLLVTGLVFPKNMTAEERSKIQSEIFLDINSNSKPVPQNVLLHIKRISNPIADESIAQFVIEQLNNEESVFQNRLQVSSLDKGRIRTASIVKFALKYLVTVSPANGKKSLFNCWDGNKEALASGNTEAIKDYVKFCAKVIDTYFKAIKNNFDKQWSDPNSKLLSVTSINGFIIAFTYQLERNGIQEYNFYNCLFQKWKNDFPNNDFNYTSSQYRKFSKQILDEVFGITEEIKD